MSCPVCRKFADIALSIQHEACGHRSHVDCLVEPYDFDNCAACAAPVEHAVAQSRAAAATAMAIREPRTTDNINYILNPGRKQPASTIAKVAAWVPGLSARFVETIDNTTNPEFLLRHHVPIQDIMIDHDMGLDHFLKAGVTMDDFLTNRYTWDDLLLFEDISGRRGSSKLPLQAITIGLKANANHFQAYADAFPYEKVRAHTGFQPVELGELFGLYFPEDGSPLQCEGNWDWRARECIEMGLTMDDLCVLGLQYVDQYAALMSGLNAKDVATMQKKLGVKPEHLKALMEPPQEPVRVVAVAPAPPVREHVSEYVREEEPEQIPARMRVAAPAPVQVRVHQAPLPRAKLVGPVGNAKRFDRHGALLYQHNNH